MGVDRGASVPDQQDAGVAIGDGLLLGSGVIDCPPGPKTDVAMRIHQPRHDPGVPSDGLRATDRFSADHTIGNPQVGRFRPGQDDSGQVPRGHQFLLADGCSKAAGRVSAAPCSAG